MPREPPLLDLAVAGHLVGAAEGRAEGLADVPDHVPPVGRAEVVLVVLVDGLEDVVEVPAVLRGVELDWRESFDEVAPGFARRAIRLDLPAGTGREKECKEEQGENFAGNSPHGLVFDPSSPIAQVQCINARPMSL